MFQTKSILNVAGILVAGILSAVLVILSHTVPVFLPLWYAKHIGIKAVFFYLLLLFHSYTTIIL